MEIDREEGYNGKIGFPLRKHVVPAPSFSDARGFAYLFISLFLKDPSYRSLQVIPLKFLEMK